MKKAKIAFTIFLMFYILILLFMTSGYDQKSAIFPILVCSGTLLLGLLSLATELLPKLSRLTETNLFEVGVGREKARGSSTEGIDFRNFLRTGFWLVLLLLLVFLVGFLISLPIWIFCYIFFQGKRPWGYALLTAFVLWIFVYGFFVEIMALEFFKGIIFGDML
jgi:hypothetical protein